MHMGKASFRSQRRDFIYPSTMSPGGNLPKVELSNDIVCSFLLGLAGSSSEAGRLSFVIF
jgi:hypothetical protein